MNKKIIQFQVIPCWRKDKDEEREHINNEYPELNVIYVLDEDGRLWVQDPDDYKWEEVEFK